MQDQSIVEIQPAPPPPPAPWSVRALWVGFALSIFLYLTGSYAGGRVIRAFGLQEGSVLGTVLAFVQLSMAIPPLVIMARHGNLINLLGLNHLPWRALLTTAVMTGAGFCGSMLWGLVLLPFGLRAQEPIVPLFGDGPAAFLIIFVVGAIMAPIVEEIVFRGFLFGGLRQQFTPTVAVLLSGALFGALHFQLYAFPALTLLGILLALLYQRTNTLWAPILMHACINSVALIAQYVALQQGLI